MLRYHFDFVPERRAFGWSINDDGHPRVWWGARLGDESHLTLADGRNAHELEANVELAILEHVRDKEMFASTRGVLVAPHDDDDEPSLMVYLAVSQSTFDRVLQAIQRQQLPTVVVGFGPKGFARKLTEGPIIPADEGGTLHYRFRWSDAKEHAVIDECEFRFSKAPEQAEEPEIPEQTPAVLRVLSVVWNIFANVLTLLIAFAVLRVASTSFETAVVSLLLLFYVYWRSSQVGFSRVLVQFELAGLARFYTLRGMLGLPASEAENKFMKHAKEGSDSPGYRYWIESVSNSIIGLVALYKLGALVLS